MYPIDYKTVVTSAMVSAAHDKVYRGTSQIKKNCRTGLDSSRLRNSLLQVSNAPSDPQRRSKLTPPSRRARTARLFKYYSNRYQPKNIEVEVVRYKVVVVTRPEVGAESLWCTRANPAVQQ
jgi:hypothetical protein